MAVLGAAIQGASKLEKMIQPEELQIKSCVDAPSSRERTMEPFEGVAKLIGEEDSRISRSEDNGFTKVAQEPVLGKIWETGKMAERAERAVLRYIRSAFCDRLDLLGSV